MSSVFSFPLVLFGRYLLLYTDLRPGLEVLCSDHDLSVSVRGSPYLVHFRSFHLPRSIHDTGVPRKAPALGSHQDL